MANANIKVSVEGQREFKQAMANMTQASKTLTAQLGKVTSEFDSNTSAQEAARKQIPLLTEQIENENKKLNTQKEHLSKVTQAYGENSTQALKLKENIAKTETNINKLNNKLENCKTDLNNTGDSASSATKKFSLLKTAMNSIDTSKLSSKLNTLSNTMAKTLVAGATAAVGAIVSLGKQSVEAYSELQQLKGGIEKLYGEDAQSVISNAEEAYKTAGVSASTYLSTVTTFSASLISSLGDDTTKAVEYADLALTDMADNSSTFGTDIETIQNAYQGFAKENFQMLDNLSLGFAGSKTGMQELLDTAEELTGKEFNIDNFADIVEAIHAVQTEWDITGTTAKESSQTIQGSIDSMKSAWDNLVAGLADPEADIGLLVGNMTDSVSTVLKNLTPVVKTFIQNVPQALKSAFPGATSTINALEKGLDGLLTIIPKLMPLVNGLVENLGTITIGSIGVTAITKLGSSLSGTVTAINAGKKAYDGYKTASSEAASKITNLKTKIDEVKKSTANFTLKENELKASLNKSNASATASYETLKVLKQKYDEGKISAESFKSEAENLKNIFDTSVKEVKKTSDEIDNLGLKIDGNRTILKGYAGELDGVQKNMDEMGESITSNLPDILSNIGSVVSSITMIGTAAYSAYEIIDGIYEDYLNDIYGMSDAQQELSSSASEAAANIQSMNESSASSQEEADSNTEYYSSLAKELESLADESGKVKEADEDRVEFILNTLNGALGTEYKLNGDIIQNYKDLTKEVYNLIEAQRLEVYAKNAKSEWETAISNQKVAFQDASKAYTDYYNYLASDEYDVVNQYNRMSNEINDAIKNGDAEGAALLQQGLSSWYQVYGKKVEKAKEKAAELKDTYDTEVANYEEYQDDILKYEAYFAAQQAKDEEAMTDILENGVTERTAQYAKEYDSSKTYTDLQIQHYADKKNALSAAYNELIEEYGTDETKWTTTQKEQIDKALSDLVNFTNLDLETAAKDKGFDVATSFTDGYVEYIELDKKVDTTTSNVVDDATSNAKEKASQGGKDVGLELINSAANAASDPNGIVSSKFVKTISDTGSNGKDEASSEGTQVGNKLISETNSAIENGDLSKSTQTLLNTSKSTANATSFFGVGTNIVDGTKKGIQDPTHRQGVFTAISNFAKTAFTTACYALGIRSPSRLFKDGVGKQIIKGVEVGLLSETSNAKKVMSKSMSSLYSVANDGLSQALGVSSSDGLNYNITLKNQTNMEQAMVNALSGVEVKLDGSNMGRFVEKTVTNSIYR